MITRRLVLTGLAAAPGVWAASACAGPVEVTGDTPDAVLESALRQSGAPPAMAAAAVAQDGVRWQSARGLRRAGGSDRVTQEERWHLGSNTKAMTAALWGRLVDQDRARWGQPLSECFPGLTLDSSFAAATIDDLFHHRAGLRDADVIGRPWFMTARDDARSLPEQRAALAAAALTRPPGGQPGAFAYGNLNYMVAGAAIERITGQAWEEVMRAELFDPLGITSGGFGAPPRDNAWGHRSILGVTAAVEPGPGADNPLALGPAGTAFMTLADYARFLGVFLKAGAGWLRPETVGALITPPQGQGRPYAKGWGLTRPGWAEGTPVLAHEGSNTLWHALVLVAADKGKALIVCANAFAPPVMQAVARRLVEMA